jgi:hypothetical protein
MPTVTSAERFGYGVKLKMRLSIRNQHRPEWQIWHGRKIVSRHELWRDAQKAANTYVDTLTADLKRILQEQPR